MKTRILLADDDESVRRMIARVMESAGYAVTQASTGGEAVAGFRPGETALVLLDLDLPDQDGWEVFAQIKKLAPLTPVILITALTDQYRQAVRLGVDALMEKPLDLQLLIESIAELLAESKQQRTERLASRDFATVFLG